MLSSSQRRIALGHLASFEICLQASSLCLSLSLSLARARASACAQGPSERAARASARAGLARSRARSLARSLARALGRTDLVGLVRSLARSLKPCLHAVKTLLCSVGSIGSVRASAQCVRLCVQASAPKHKSAHAQWCKPFSLGDKFAPSLLSRGLKSAIDDYASPPSFQHPAFRCKCTNQLSHVTASSRWSLMSPTCVLPSVQRRVCVGGLLQTDPQERAKTTTASPCAPTKDVVCGSVM